MRIAQTHLTLDTEPREIKEITAEIQHWVEAQGVGTGLLTVYIPHTSASLLIQEKPRPMCAAIWTSFCGAWCPRTPHSIVTTTRDRTTCQRTSRAC
jgi:thiamine phosphate synthase YjbQ (UPF0047 family)